MTLRNSRLLHGCGFGAIAGVLIALWPNLAAAQIAGDGTVGTQVNGSLTGTCTGTCLIEGGTVRGVNLYHSFREFSVPTGGTAWFNNAPQIQNILTRVTGLNPSNIDGLIRANGTANLFFLNPNGILFGPNARLQIGGSFLASTANRFQFADGSEFSATNPQAPPLLMVSITPGLQTGAIAAGSTITNRGNLAAPQDLVLEADRLDVQGQLVAGRDLTLKAQDTVQANDTSLSPLILSAGRTLLMQGDRAINLLALSHPDSGLFSGGDMVLRSANPVGGDAHFYAGRSFRIEQLDGSPGNLFSPNDPIIRSQGDVTFFGYVGASLHILSGGAVNIDQIVITGPDGVGSSINPINTPQLANVVLSDGTALTIDGSARPTVDIRAGMDPAEIGAPLGTSGAGFPANIFFTAALGLAAPPANNPVRTSADITIGGILAPSGQILMTNQYQPDRQLPGGTITINGTTGFGTTFGLGVGSATADAGTIAIDSRAGIAINGAVYAGSTVANGGSVRLLAQGDITVAPTGEVNTSGQTAGGAIAMNSRAGGIALNGAVGSGSPVGTGGTVQLVAQGDISVAPTGLIATPGEAAGGAIAINSRAGGIALNGAVNSSSLLGNGGAVQFVAPGDITVTPTGFIATNGQLNGAITLNALGQGSINLAGDVGGVSASTTGGKGGDIQVVNARSLNLTNGARLFTTTAATSTAAGGDVFINALDGVQAQGERLIAGQVQGSGIFASTSGTGIGGNIVLFASTSGTGIGGNIVLFASTSGTGIGGNIVLNTPQLILRAGGQVAANTGGPGQGGNLTILNANRIELDGTTSNGLQASSLGTNALAAGNAGITQLTTNQLLIQNGAQIGAGTFGAGNGGKIMITAADIQLTGRGSIAPSGLFTISTASASGNAGDIDITTGRLLVSNGATLNAQTTNSQGGNLSIRANQVQVQSGGEIVTSTAGGGASGNLTIQATDLVWAEGDSSLISSQSRLGTTGRAGSVSIRSDRVLVQNGAQIDSSSFGAGQGGTVLINANTIDLSGTSSNGQFVANISANANSPLPNAGNAGTVTLNTQQLRVQNGAQIGVGTFGGGQGGDLIVNASDFVQLLGTSSEASSSLFSAAASGSTGNAGTIRINTPRITMQSDSDISVRTAGSGAAGSIVLQPFNGNSLSVQLQDEARIRASTSNTGAGGNIVITAPEAIALSGPGDISAGSSGSGAGGNIQLVTRTLTLQDGVNVSASTSGSGKAGDIGVEAETLTLTGAAKLSTNTSGSGAAGNLTVNVNDTLFLSGRGTGLFASTTSGSTGPGGNITVDPRRVLIEDGATIAVDSKGSGTGGNIFLQAGRLTLNRQGSITAETASAQGGNISLDVKDLLLLRRNSLISATAGTAQAGGNGGNITIRAPFIIGVLAENSDITANAFTGSGGSINITTNAIYGLKFQPTLTPFSDITASSQFGLSGTVAINALNVDPSRGLVALPVNLTDPAQQISQACNATKGDTARKIGSFRVAGRGGLPESPDTAMTAEQPLVNLVEPVASSAQAGHARWSAVSPAAAKSGEIVEAQSWVQDGDGAIYLVTNADTTTAHPLGMALLNCAPAETSRSR